MASEPATKAAAIARSAAKRPASASAVETCVPLSSASPSLGPSTTGCSPASPSASRAATTRPEIRASPSPISTAARCASGARSPDAPTDPCDGYARDDAGVAQRHQRLDHRPAHAGVAARERRRLQGDDQPHRRVVEQSAGPRRMRQDQRALQLGQPGVVDAGAGEQSESRVDAIDGPAAGDDSIHRLGRRVDGGPRGRIGHERLRRRPQPSQVGKTKRAGAQCQRVHGSGEAGTCAALCPRIRPSRHTDRSAAHRI